MANVCVYVFSLVAVASFCLSVLNHLRHEDLKKDLPNEYTGENNEYSHSRNRRHIETSTLPPKAGKGLFKNIAELKEFIREEINQSIQGFLNNTLEEGWWQILQEKKCKCPGQKGKRGRQGQKGDVGLRGPKGPKGETGLGLYPPQLKSKVLDVIVKTGEEKQLSCKFFGNPLPDTRWNTSVNTTTIKTEINHERSEITTTLHVKNITWADRGEVSCFASSILGKINESGYLTVHAPPIISLPQEPVIGIIGTTVAFPECKVISSPSATIMWKRGFLSFPKQRTYTQNGILRISDLKVEDEGYYECISTNYLGTTTKFIHLRARPLEFSKKPPFYIYESNSSVALLCAAYGSPTKLFGKWSNFIDGTDVPYVTKFRNGNELLTTVVVNKTGKYKCSISNNVTKIETYVEVEMFTLKTTMMNSGQIHTLGNWLKEGNVIGEYQLCWSGTRHGFSSSEFHKRCDGKPNTISIFKNTRDVLFGGFTDVPWRSAYETFSSCGGVISSLGKITTGFYGYGYAQDCTWNIKLNVPITLEFLSFNLKWSRFCNSEYVTIEENGRTYGKFCGKNIPSKYVSSSGNLKLSFHRRRYSSASFSLAITAPFRYSSDSFLFTFSPKATKIAVHNKAKAICTTGNDGPCFGENELYYLKKSSIGATIGKSYKSKLVSLSSGVNDVSDIEVHYKV